MTIRFYKCTELMFHLWSSEAKQELSSAAEGAEDDRAESEAKHWVYHEAAHDGEHHVGPGVPGVEVSKLSRAHIQRGQDLNTRQLQEEREVQNYAIKCTFYVHGSRAQKLGLTSALKCLCFLISYKMSLFWIPRSVEPQHYQSRSMLRSPQCSSGAGPALWTQTGQDFVFLTEDILRGHHLVPAAPPTKGCLHQYILYQASFSLLSVAIISLSTSIQVILRNIQLELND